MYDKMAIKKLVRNFYDKRVGCVSGMMLYRNPKDSSTGKAETAYWKYENLLKKLSSGVVTGSIFTLRRDAYLPLNKYRGDDFELTMRAAVHGFKIGYEMEALSYEDVYDTTEKEFRRKVRVISWNFQSAWMLLFDAIKKKKCLIAFKLFSHKILRWFVPVFLITLFVSNLVISENNGGNAFNYFLLGQIFLYALASIGFIMDSFFGFKLPKILLTPYYFCMVNFAALVGIANFLSGKSGMLWEVDR